MKISNRMRILQLFNRYLEKGGEEIFVEKSTYDLSQVHDVRELVFDSADWKAEPILLKLLQPLRMLYNPKAIRKLNAVIDDFDPEVVIVHNLFPVGSLACYDRLLKLDIPIIQYIHNYRPFSVNGYCWVNGRVTEVSANPTFFSEILHGSWRDSRLMTFCYAVVLWLGHKRGIWKSIHHWIAISNHMRNTFVQGGINAERISTIRHFVDSPVLASHEAEHSGLSFLFLGRISEEKGIKVLLEAWSQVEAASNLGELIIAGDGPLKDWLSNQALGFRRLRVVEFAAGQIKSNLIQESLAVVVPSVWAEPFGMVVEEAFCAGKPVIASRIGALPERVEHGATGWLYPPGDASALASQMIQILDNPECARHFGIEANRRLVIEGGVERWQAQIQNVLSNCVSRFRRPLIKNQSPLPVSESQSSASGSPPRFIEPRKVAAVLATMNRRDTTLECARRLALQTLPIGKLFATDNGSIDGTANALIEFGQQSKLAIQVIHLDENIGNAGGVQRAMELAFSEGFEAVWILDDDSWPEPTAFESLLSAGCPTGGIRSSMVLAPDSSALSWPCEVRNQNGEWTMVVSLPDPSLSWQEIRRSWLGALIPKGAYLEVGNVNAALFLRGEDEEYPRRLERAGYKFWLASGSILRHPVAGPLVTLSFGDYKLCLERNLSADKLYYRIRNMIWIKKNDTGWPAAIILACGYFLLLVRWSRPLCATLLVFQSAVRDALVGRLGRR